MGDKQSKLHWCVLAEDWNGCRRRLQKHNGAEARSANSNGDLPLHFACYNGLAPPDIIRALLDANPGSVRKENRLGRHPLELAAINYNLDDPYREEVLYLLRWYIPPHRNNAAQNGLLPGIFSFTPPNQIYSASALCVVCMEAPSTVAMIPCGHVCLCMNCVSTAASCGRCPVDRCRLLGLYQLQGEQTNIHESMVCVEAS